MHWLTNYADGIRITEGKKSIVDSDKSSWQEIVSKVSANTFKKKLEFLFMQILNLNNKVY